jgi:hypothetical protein
MKKTRYKLIIPSIVLATLALSSCEDMWNHSVDGNGYRRLENRDLSAYDRVEINGDFEVQIDMVNESKAIVEADENLLDLIVTHVSGNKLIIETRNGTNIRPSIPVEITISTPALKEVTLNGSGLVYSYGIESEEFAINLSGSGQIQINNLVTTNMDVDLEGSGNITTEVTAENITSQLEGSGEIKLDGSSINTDYQIIGSGDIRAGQLATDICLVYISGSGSVHTRVNDVLDVTIIGSGIVYYSGDPEIESNISGSGEIRER